MTSNRRGESGSPCRMPDPGRNCTEGSKDLPTQKRMGPAMTESSTRTYITCIPKNSSVASIRLKVTESYTFLKSTATIICSGSRSHSDRAKMMWSSICLPGRKPFCSGGIICCRASITCNRIVVEIHLRRAFCSAIGCKSFGHSAPANLGRHFSNGVP